MSTSSSVPPSSGFSQSQLNHFQHVQDVDEAIFLGLQIAGGHILLPILVLTVLISPKVKRHPVSINFCLSWIFSSIVYSLLVYRGRSANDDLSLSPSYDECLVQAALINGVQALTVCATFSFIFDFWFIVRIALRNSANQSEEKRWGLKYTFLLLGIPFAFFAFFTLLSVIIGGQPIDNDGIIYPDTNLSVPSVFYCVIIVNANITVSLAPGMKLVRAVYIFSAIVSLLTLCVEADIARRLYQRRGSLSSSKNVGKAGMLLVFLRIALFSTYRVLSLFLTLAVILNPDELLLAGLASSPIYNGIIDFVQAATPLVAFIVFGTDKDVLSVWCFWKKKRNNSEEAVLSVEGGPSKEYDSNA